MALEDVRRSILVTGGGGFIGSRLVRAFLEKGRRVKVLDIQRGRLESVRSPRLEFVGLDSGTSIGGMANDEAVRQAVEDVDVVFHLAITWDGHTWKHSSPVASLFDANIRGTLNLLEASRAEGVRHFVFSSSCAVYGMSTSRVVNEEAACKPETWDGDPGRAYGIVKFATERLCLLYDDQYGLPVTAFRIDFVYDDTQALPSSTIEANLKEGKSIDVIEGDGYSAIHVEDVVKALLLVSLNKKAYGRVFNLANPASFVSYREVYELLIPQAESKSKISLRKDPHHAGRVRESTDKIRRTLGWRPQKTKDDLLKAIARSLTA